MAKQVCDIKSTKGVSAADSREQLRAWSKKQQENRMQNKNLNYDFTRTHLNFEIVNGEIKEVDKTVLLQDSIMSNLEQRGIPIPGAGKSHVKKGTPEPEKMQRNIAARMILGGSTEYMSQIAFGDQVVDFHKGADNSHITRTQEIEQWALDEYKYLEKTYGKGSVARFIVHLDEGWPHIHATVIPTAVIKGKERVSWRSVFGGSLDVSRAKWKKIIDDHYELVGKKWGLDRGDPVMETGAKHFSTRDYQKQMEQENVRLEGRIAELNKQLDGLVSDYDTLNDRYDVLKKDYNDLSKKIDSLEGRYTTLEDDLRKGVKAMKSLTTMIDNKIQERSDSLQNLQTAQYQLDAGEITPEEYETATCDTMDRLNDLDEFVRIKTDKLAEVSQKLANTQLQLKDIIDEAKGAKEYKERYANTGWWKRMMESKGIEKATDDIRDVAERLGLDGKGASLAQLAVIFKNFADDRARQLREEEKNRADLLNEMKSKGTKETIEKIRKAAGRNWKPDVTAEQIGKWYKQYASEHQQLKDFHQENGKSVFDYVNDLGDELKEHQKQEKKQQGEISSLRKMIPTLDQAIKSIIGKFNDNDRNLSFSMEEAEPVWRVLSTASTKEDCYNIANSLLAMARAKAGDVTDIRYDDAAECVWEVADSVNPLSALFSLLPDVGMGAGGVTNNDLPRKKKDDDEDNRRAIFNGIMNKTRKARGRKM